MNNKVLISKSQSREPAFDEKNYFTGITRRKIKDGFEYYYIKTGLPVEKKEMIRINKLGIPPAWINVWVSSDPKSSIQATGLDSKNIKQYRYHQLHIERAEEQKFLRIYDFVKAIPKLEQAIRKHEKLGPYSYKKVIASMLVIVRELHMRVGKEVYARKNKSYGVSSLRKIHMTIQGSVIKFRFKGKSRKRLSYTLDDKLLATHLKLLLKLEGDKLFQYIDENNKVRGVTDMDLNRYIQAYIGNKYTVKDFRTYASNYYFIKSLLTETKKRLPKNQKIIKRNILNSLKNTSYYLRHSKAISKKSYVLSFASDLYKSNPKYFIDRKEDDADEVLIDILKMYKNKILNI